LLVSVTGTLSRSVDSSLAGVGSAPVSRQYRNSREVDVETGEIPDWIGRQLARLPGEWGDAVDVGDVDRENGFPRPVESPAVA